MKRNRLNELTGSEWLYFTNLLWQTSYPPDATHKLRKAHGAMKPPQAMRELVEFFTKSGELVLDPFAGVGGVLLGAELAGRRALGFEINPRWIEIFDKIKELFCINDGKLVAKAEEEGDGKLLESEIRCGDCLALMEELEPLSVDAVITDPPYGPQSGNIAFDKETNFAMSSGGAGDFGNAKSVEEFLDWMVEFGRKAHRVLKDKRYIALIVGDRYIESEFILLGSRVAMRLRDCGYLLKGIKIWWNSATQRPLKPYAVGTSFAPNITYQNVIILRKK